jgi:hypothetical protein
MTATNPWKSSQQQHKPMCGKEQEGKRMYDKEQDQPNDARRQTVA